MKKIFLSLLGVICLLSAFSQAKIVRTTASNTVYDTRHGAILNQILPVYSDTTQANLTPNIGLDSCGALIFTRTDNKMWKRTCSPKAWVEVGGGGGSGTVTAAQQGLTLNGTAVELGSTTPNASSFSNPRYINTNGQLFRLTSGTNYASFWVDSSIATGVGLLDLAGEYGGLLRLYGNNPTARIFPGIEWYYGGVFKAAIGLDVGGAIPVNQLFFDSPLSSDGVTAYAFEFGGTSQMILYKTGLTYIGIRAPRRTMIGDPLGSIGQTLNVGGSLFVADSTLLWTPVGTTSDSVLVKTTGGLLRAVSQSSVAGVNIYNSNGTLTSNRTLTGGSNSFTFTGLSSFNISSTPLINSTTSSNTSFSARNVLTQDGGRLFLQSSGAFLGYDTVTNGYHNYLEIDPVWFHIHMDSQNDSLKIDNLHLKASGWDTTDYKIMLNSVNIGSQFGGHTVRANWSDIIAKVTPTLQQVITAGSTLTTDNSINAGNHVFGFTNMSDFTIDDGTSIRIAYDASQTVLNNVSNSINVYVDSTSIKPYLGRLNIDSLRSGYIDTTNYKPLARKASGEIVQMNSWAQVSGGSGSSAISALTPAVATNSILNSTFAQTWNWDQLRTGNALTITGGLVASTTTGDIRLLNIDANDIVVQDGHTLYGVYADATPAGGVGPTTSRSIAIYANATNSIVNHAIFVDAGTVNLNPLTATTILGLNASKNIVSAALSGLTWDGTTLTVTGGSTTWNGISNPTGDQALTFDAGESSTWISSNTTEDLFTVNSSTTTTSSMFSINRTGTALASGNNIIEVISSGANGTNAITATGMVISVTNTNATSGTNIGLNVTASGATTSNLAISATGNNLFTSNETKLKAASGVTALKIEYQGGTTIYWESQVDGSGNIIHNAQGADAIFRRQGANIFTYSASAVTLVSGVGLTVGAGTATVAPITLTTATAITTPAAGKIEYTTPRLFFTNGGLVRQEIPQIQQSRVSTQYDNTTTTLGNVTGLTSSVAASRTYRFEATLYTTSNVGGGIKVAIGGTATATAVIYEGLVTDGGTTTQGRSTTLGTAVAGVTAVTASMVRIFGTITVNAAGTLTVMSAANVATGTTSVLVGSSFVLTEML